MQPVAVAQPPQKVCCFEIPSGAKTVAIIELVFVSICILGAIGGIFTGLKGGTVAGIFQIGLLIGLGVCAFLLMKAVNENREGLCLPYAIVKIIHLIFQGLYILGMLGVLAVMGVATAVVSSDAMKREDNGKHNFGFDDDDREQANTLLTLAMVVAVLLLILNGTWFIMGIIGCVVAFKTRTFLKTNSATQPGGVILTQQPMQQGYPPQQQGFPPQAGYAPPPAPGYNPPMKA